MKNYQKSYFFWYILTIIEWNIQTKQYCKSAKHTSLTAKSAPSYVLFLQFRPLNGDFKINWQQKTGLRNYYMSICIRRQGQNHDTQLSFKANTK